MSKLPFYIITWLLFLIFRTVVILLGLLLIPPMAIFSRYTTKIQRSMVNQRFIITWKYRFMYPWSNDEDGIVAGDELKNFPNWIRIIYWSAIRNPANNLRFIKGLGCKIEPDKVEFSCSDVKMIDGRQVAVLGLNIFDEDRFRFTSLTWQGHYSNLRIQFKMFGKIWRFWIGWKIYPHDSNGIADNNYRKHGAGFATQFKRIYPR